MATVTRRVAARPRDYVRVAGPDAADFLQRMLSNDVEQAPCRAMLLTPKARLIAPLVVVRRADDDFLLLTEPGLGDAVSSALLRARFAAKVEIESEEHVSVIALGEEGEIPNDELGEPGAELLDSDAEPTLSERESERLRIEASAARVGQGARRLDPSGRSRSRRNARLVLQGLLPGPGADRAPSVPGEGQPQPAGAGGRRRRAG